MRESSPWEEIPVPTADFNVLQIAAHPAVNCFWGRSAGGACLFLLELDGDHTSQFRRSAVKLNGVEIDLRSGVDAGQRLILSLGKQVDRDLFEGLCRTLVSALHSATDSATSLEICLAHLRRWKAFLSGSPVRLSKPEICGLFGELIFLEELLGNSSSCERAIGAWLGSEGSHQDFILGDRSIEVKAVTGLERNAVRISSEDQLESLNETLFLRVYRLGELSSGVGTRSLNEAVSAVHSRLSSAESLESFDGKLASRGYTPIPAYDEPRFAVTGARTFRVVQGFPRLIRSLLPKGVANVSYDVAFEELSAFECENGTVFS